MAASPFNYFRVALAGAAFGLTGAAFAQASHRYSNWISARIRDVRVRAAVAGVAVALGIWALGTTRYIGLGLLAIAESFERPSAPQEFALKLIFTVVTLGSGFRGGEVTPLFFIGATLGSALSVWLGLPCSWLAALGFVAVFAGAANTPIACTLMAIEVFGGEIAVPAALACVCSYVFSGHAGIYSSQRIGQPKVG